MGGDRSGDTCPGAVLGAQVTSITGVFGEEWLGTWMGLGLFDMDEFGEPDYYEDVRYDPSTGEGPTEADVRSWCEAGDVPVPPDWFYYQRELLSGDIDVTG